MFFDTGYKMAVSVENHMLKVEHFLKHSLRATSRSVGRYAGAYSKAFSGDRNNWTMRKREEKSTAETDA